MKNGDISNQAAVTIAFRCEDFLIKFKEDNFVDKVLNKFDSMKVSRANIDEKVANVMRHYYRNTEYTVDLVVMNENYTGRLREMIDEFPYSRVILIDKLTQISSRLLIGDISFYVDDDDYRRKLVNSKYAYTLEELRREVR